MRFLITMLRDALGQRISRDMVKTRKINTVIIHCSATPPDLDIGADTIRVWHKKNGWSDIGYHDVIRRDGSIEQGRPIEKAGAHVKGHNQDSIGICLIGGVDSYGVPENNFTDIQWKSLKKLIRVYNVQYPYATVHGHNEYSNKACPSFKVQEWLQREFIR